PYCWASSIISAVRRSSSSRPRGTLRCVERCCPSAAQARRSETCSCARTCSMQARRRAGLRSFPGQPPAERAYPASDRKPPCAAGCSRAQGPSGASPARSLARRTPGATDNTSPRSRRSGGLRPPCSGPVRPKHRPAATSRRSLQACIASLPLQSSLMSKTYLKSDYFNGGGSIILGDGNNVIEITSGQINGAIVTGTGNNQFTMSGGIVTGDVNLGNGSNVLTMTGGQINGNVALGGTFRINRSDTYT